MPSVSSTSQSPDPYLNFKFRIKWPGQVRRRPEQVQRPEAQHRGDALPRRRRSEHEPHPAGPDQVRADHARARHDAGSRIRNLGQPSVELSRRPGNGELARQFPSQHHARILQRRGAISVRVQHLQLLALRIHRDAGARSRARTPWRSRRSCCRTRAGSATPASRFRRRPATDSHGAASAERRRAAGCRIGMPRSFGGRERHLSRRARHARPEFRRLRCTAHRRARRGNRGAAPGDVRRPDRAFGEMPAVRSPARRGDGFGGNACDRGIGRK